MVGIFFMSNFENPFKDCEYPSNVSVKFEGGTKYS